MVVFLIIIIHWDGSPVAAMGFHYFLIIFINLYSLGFRFHFNLQLDLLHNLLQYFQLI